MRGEHANRINTVIPETGSSPHARGAQPPEAVDEQQEGVIPACAGSTPHLRVLP